MSNRDTEATYNGPAQAIPFAIAEWVRQNLRTSIPGLVRAYDARTMRARVQPALNAIVSQPDGSTEAMERAPIYDVPVQWPGGGGFVFHCDLNAGDPVWLLFSERGIGEFKRTLELADPPAMVMFETRDAVAYPYRAAEIEPVGGTTGGDIRDVTPTASGPVTSVVGATMQAADGDPYIHMEPGQIIFRVGDDDARNCAGGNDPDYPVRHADLGHLMPGVARVSADTAGGTQLGGGQSWVSIGGNLVVLIGDAVASHAPCPVPASHCAATMAAGSAWVRIDGIPICRAGDAASCGHPSTGSAWVDSS